MPRSRHAVWGKGCGLEGGLLSLGTDNKEFVGGDGFSPSLFIDIGGLKGFF
jgi:hypothetical protein